MGEEVLREEYAVVCVALDVLADRAIRAADLLPYGRHRSAPAVDKA